jgi:hypothetical protein
MLIPWRLEFLLRLSSRKEKSVGIKVFTFNQHAIGWWQSICDNIDRKIVYHKDSNPRSSYSEVVAMTIAPRHHRTVINTKFCSGAGNAWQKLIYIGRFCSYLNIFLCISRKRVSLVRTLQIPEQSIVLRTELWYSLFSEWRPTYKTYVCT